MKRITFFFCLAVAAVIAWAAAKADDDVALPDDEPTTVNGVDVACTGVGDEARNDPRWRDYAVRIEFAGGEAQYLADLDIAITDSGGAEVVEARCNSPWLVADLSPGKYVVTGTFQGLTKTAKFTAPASGQARVVVRFPEVVGN